MLLITSARVRAIISDCKTEPEIIRKLRAHGIKYRYSTETGYINIRIACKKGTIRIYRTASRSRPFLVRQDIPVPFVPVKYPVLHNDY